MEEDCDTEMGSRLVPIKVAGSRVRMKMCCSSPQAALPGDDLYGFHGESNF
jgi:hypothetical protein